MNPHSVALEMDVEDCDGVGDAAPRLERLMATQESRSKALHSVMNQVQERVKVYRPAAEVRSVACSARYRHVFDLSLVGGL